MSNANIGQVQESTHRSYRRQYVCQATAHARDGAVICLEGFMDIARFQRTEFMVCSLYFSPVYRCLYAEVIVDCKLPPRSGLVRQCLGHIESLINGSGVGMRSLTNPAWRGASGGKQPHSFA